MRPTAVLAVLAQIALVQALPAQEPVSAHEVRTVLARYDEAFDARDLDACMGLFQSEYPELHAILRARLAMAFAGSTRIVQVSELDGNPWQVGPRTVARVRHERCAASKPDARPITEWCYFAFKRDADRVIPVMAVEFYPGMMIHVLDGRFSCPPCNYTVGGPEGWLPVPLPPERANAMEAVSFYLLGTDLAFDVSVHIEAEPGKPRPAVESLVAEIRATVPDVKVEFLGDWTPPSLAGVADHGMEGEQVRLRLPDGREQWIFLCTMGVMRYLMVAQGASGTLRRRDAAVQAMLRTFELKDPQISEDRLATHPLLMHTGGRLDDCLYVNTRHGLEFSGPPEWIPGQRSGAFLFRVHFACPEGGAGIWVTGYPNGGADPEQRARLADRMLADLCRKGDLSIDPDGDSGWQPASRVGGFRTRTVQTRPTTGSDREPFLFRLVLKDDLLVVLSGYAANDSQRELVRNAFDSLRAR